MEPTDAQRLYCVAKISSDGRVSWPIETKFVGKDEEKVLCIKKSGIGYFYCYPDGIGFESSEAFEDLRDEFEPCGAQEWYWAGEDEESSEVVIQCTCERPKGHSDRWHLEMRDGEVWGSWSDSTNSKAPADAIVVLPS